MSADNRASGLLNDLQKLDEAGRERILKVLPAEDTISVLMTSLREHDGYGEKYREYAGIRNNTTPDTHVRLTIHTAPVGLNLSIADVDRVATESDATARAVVKREHAIIDLVSEDDSKKDAHASGVEPKKSGNETIEQMLLRKNDVSIRNLRLYVKVPVADGEMDILKIDQLPNSVCNELERRFSRIWGLNQRRILRYSSILRKPGHYLHKQCCIRALILRGQNNMNQTFAKGGKLGEAADDRCIKFGDLCAHLIEQDGEIGICMVPLPGAFRYGKTWDEIGYWVLQKPTETTAVAGC